MTLWAFFYSLKTDIFKKKRNFGAKKIAWAEIVSLNEKLLILCRVDN